MIEDGHNLDKVELFLLRDFIQSIRISNSTLEHMEETSQEFDKYMKTLSQFKQKDVLNYWLSESYNEIIDSNRIENHFISRKEILKSDLFEKVVNKPLTHPIIERLHQFSLQDKKAKREKYRKSDIRVSSIYEDGREEIFWFGAEPEDVQQFMDDFLDVYNTNTISVINSNPFLKSALIHLLFVRIHPFSDGNGRTARLLQSIKFTESISRLYGKKFNLCPINLSESIYINRNTYVNIINNIYFDITNNNTKYMNKWFDFMLNMVDEQIFHRQTHIANLEAAQLKYDNNDEKLLLELGKLIPRKK